MTYSAGPEDLGAATASGAQSLFFVTLVLLFVPRLLGIVTALSRARQFGGFIRLLISALLENLISIALAPVLMIFHTFFVLLTVFGLQIKWTTQNRADTGLSISHCLSLYGWLSGLGIVGLWQAWTYLGPISYWLMPIFVGWILAPFLAWLTSLSSVGVALRRWGFFLTPEEINPPPELAGLADDEAEKTSSSPLWIQALLCPYVQAVHLSMVRQRLSGTGEEPAPSQSNLRERLLREGPQVLGPKEKLRLLWDAETVFWLHQELWSRPAAELHPTWTQLQTECSRNPLLSNYLMVSPT